MEKVYLLSKKPSKYPVNPGLYSDIPYPLDGQSLTRILCAGKVYP
jgi:hypothetical protein